MRESRDIDRPADDAVSRCIRGDATAAEMALTRAWRASSAEHEAEYRDMVRIVTLSACLPALVSDQQPPTAHDVMARRLAARSEPTSARTTRRRRSADGSRRWLFAAAALLILGFPILLLVRLGSADGTLGFGAQAFVTGPAATATVILSDGSVVKLAPQSRLSLEPNRSERRVTLDGQAFFSVAPMNGRPFVVRAAKSEVRVLGTRFDLAARDQDLQLAVVEGRVAISGGLEGEIRAGQVGRVVDGTPLPVLEIDDPHELTEWTGQFIAFQSTPLADAAREIMRHYPVRIVLTDSAVARRTITAWFSDWKLEDVITVVCAVAEAHCTTEGDVITIEPDRKRGASQ